MMLNSRRRLHHSSREKHPVVDKSASWFWVSTYLIMILTTVMMARCSGGVKTVRKIDGLQMSGAHQLQQ